jgi:hypothetical protein
MADNDSNRFKWFIKLIWDDIPESNSVPNFHQFLYDRVLFSLKHPEIKPLS